MFLTPIRVRLACCVIAARLWPGVCGHVWQRTARVAAVSSAITEQGTTRHTHTTDVASEDLRCHAHAPVHQRSSCACMGAALVFVAHTSMRTPRLPSV